MLCPYWWGGGLTRGKVGVEKPGFLVKMWGAIAVFMSKMKPANTKRR